MRRRMPGIVEAVIRRFRPGDEDSVIGLWRECGLLRPWNDPRDEIAGNQKSVSGRLFVAASINEVVGSVMVGYDGRRGWINYLAVLPTHRRRGLGTMLMATAESYLAEIGCSKVNLQVRESNQGVVAFYAALGYSDDHVMSLGKRLK